MTSNILAKKTVPTNSNVMEQKNTVLETGFRISEKWRSIIKVGTATVMVWVMANPVMAGDSLVKGVNACTANGLFPRVTNFIVTALETITVGGIESGTLSRLICSTTEFFVVGLCLAFIATMLRLISFEVQQKWDEKNN